MRAMRAGSFALLLCTACSKGDSPAEPEILAACTRIDIVTVSPGTTPEFDWSPRCRVGSILVEPVPRGIGDRWSIRADTNAIAPPLRYGVAPVGVVIHGPYPLETGIQYRLVIATRGDVTGEAFAIRLFTP
jgi:hypothetical protein